jgi:hypothetical protein
MNILPKSMAREVKWPSVTMPVVAAVKQTAPRIHTRRAHYISHRMLLHCNLVQFAACSGPGPCTRKHRRGASVKCPVSGRCVSSVGVRLLVLVESVGFRFETVTAAAQIAPFEER